MAVEMGSDVHVPIPERTGRQDTVSAADRAWMGRWETGMWLGHVRHTPESLLTTESGIVKANAVRRLRGRIKDIKGSPANKKLDAIEEPEMVELEDQGDAEIDPRLENRVGWRTGERRAMYVSRKDFADYGHTDGCVGCRDIASGRRGQVAPHTVACQRRIEEAVK